MKPLSAQRSPLTDMEVSQYFFLVQIFYKLTINCTKLSILFLYLRIFTDKIPFVRTCWSLICIVVLSCACFTTATIMQCSPVRAAWHRWDAGSTCVNIYALWYSNAIYNILTDFIIILMVPPVIFTLKISWRQKLALVCIFGLGAIVCAASISRLTTLYSSAYGNDPMAGSLVSTIWTTIEAGLGIICANLPMLRTPIQRLFPLLFPSGSSTFHITSTATSAPCASSNNETLVSPTSIVPKHDVETGIDDGSQAEDSSSSLDHGFQCFNANDISFWRPSLDPLPEHEDFELHVRDHRNDAAD